MIALVLSRNPLLVHFGASIYQSSITSLSVVDGANDVAMIKASTPFARNQGEGRGGRIGEGGRGIGGLWGRGRGGRREGVEGE